MDQPSPSTADPFVLYLLTEKERLLREKEEMLDSKHKLWQTFNDMLHERDAEVESLRKEARTLAVENERVKGKAQQLGEELCDLLDNDSVSEDGTEASQNQDEGQPEYNHYNDAGTLWAISNNQQIDQTYIPKKSVDSSVAIRPDASNSAALKPAPLHRPKFNIEPLLGPTPAGSAIMGAFNQLALEVQESVDEVLKDIAQRNAKGGLAAHPTGPISSCARMWARDATSKVRWTLQSPGRHTCYTCFKLRKACMSWRGNMRWWILPLPKEVRPEGAMYTDKEFYIYPGNQNGTAFPGTWEASKDRRNKKRKAAAAEC